MKKQLIILCGLLVMTMSFTACKSKTSDADIKTSVTTALNADPMMSNIAVNVDKGVVTLTGTCKDEASKAQCTQMAKGLKGVKEVVNNCTVEPPPPVVVTGNDDELTRGLTDALKDNPGVHFSVVEGKIALTGEIAKAKWVKLKQTLDKLKSKGYELSGLKIN